MAPGRFLNHTDDRSLDEVLSAPFRVKMDESPYLRLVSNEQFARALPKSSPDDSLGDELEACRGLHARLLLNGQVTRAEAGFDLEVNAYDCAQTKRIATVMARADSQDDLLPALGRACEKMRLRLGESRATLDRFDVPLVQATTSSRGGAARYRLGEQRHLSGNDTESKTYYQLAIDLDHSVRSLPTCSWAGLTPTRAGLFEPWLLPTRLRSSGAHHRARTPLHHHQLLQLCHRRTTARHRGIPTLEHTLPAGRHPGEQSCRPVPRHGAQPRGAGERPPRHPDRPFPASTLRLSGNRSSAEWRYLRTEGPV